MESYANVKELANKGNTDDLAEMQQKALENKDYVLALYIESFMQDHKLSDKKSAAANESINKPITSKKTDIYCPIVWVEAGVILVVISVIILRKKQDK